MQNLKEEEEEESSSTLVMQTGQQLQGLALSVLAEPHSHGGPRTKKKTVLYKPEGGEEDLCCPSTSLVVLAPLFKNQSCNITFIHFNKIVPTYRSIRWVWFGTRSH